MNAWIVSRGSYSDYRVLFVCLDEQVAHEAVMRITGHAERDAYGQYGEEQVEEIPLVSALGDITAELRWNVSITEHEAPPHSSIERYREYANARVEWSLGDPLPEPRLQCYGEQAGGPRGWSVYTTASWYRTEAEAWKVAREAHARAIAERTGL